MKYRQMAQKCVGVNKRAYAPRCLGDLVQVLRWWGSGAAFACQGGFGSGWLAGVEKAPLRGLDGRFKQVQEVVQKRWVHGDLEAARVGGVGQFFVKPDAQQTISGWVQCDNSDQQGLWPQGEGSGLGFERGFEVRLGDGLLFFEFHERVTAHFILV